MSRVGRKLIKIPAKVKVVASERSVGVEGPLGKLSAVLPAGVQVVVEGEVVRVTAPETNRKNRGFQGLVRALLQNMVHGVVHGYRHEIENIGVGYKFELKGSNLVVSAGYSHTVTIPVPEGIKAKVVGSNTLHVTFIDKEAGGQFAAKVCGVKRPEPYKGKGIKFVGQVITRKAGKTGAK